MGTKKRAWCIAIATCQARRSVTLYPRLGMERLPCAARMMSRMPLVNKSKRAASWSFSQVTVVHFRIPLFARPQGACPVHASIIRLYLAMVNDKLFGHSIFIALPRHLLPFDPPKYLIHVHLAVLTDGSLPYHIPGKPGVIRDIEKEPGARHVPHDLRFGKA